MTNPTRTRAEIQAEIEKRRADIEKLEQEWKDAWPKEGHAVWLMAFVRQLDEDTVDVEVVGDSGDICTVSYDALIPTADIIAREEHEWAVEEAKELSFLPALDRVVKAIAEGEVSEFPVRKINGIDCRLTVERVKEKTPEMPSFVCGKECLTVAPEGVVKELRRIAQGMAERGYYTEPLSRAINEVVELPEPPEWMMDIITNFPLKTGEDYYEIKTHVTGKSGLLELAAALIQAAMGVDHDNT